MTDVECPDCGLMHAPEDCRREAADCDCCAAIEREAEDEL